MLLPICSVTDGIGFAAPVGIALFPLVKVFVLDDDNEGAGSDCETPSLVAKRSIKPLGPA